MKYLNLYKDNKRINKSINKRIILLLKIKFSKQIQNIKVKIKNGKDLILYNLLIEIS